MTTDDDRDLEGPSGALTWPITLIAVYALVGALTWACIQMAVDPSELRPALLERPARSGGCELCRP